MYRKQINLKMPSWRKSAKETIVKVCEFTVSIADLIRDRIKQSTEFAFAVNFLMAVLSGF